MDWETPEFYERHSDAVTKDLATALRSGSLCLMVGAGISKQLNLPLWYELVLSCCQAAPTGVDCSGIDATTSADDLLYRMQSVRGAFGNDSTYMQIVSDCLYSGWATPAIAAAPELMRAIGVLAMGSVRGRIKTIVNFNFDSLLEWYLSFHGYVVQVIEDVPRGLVDSDVQIYHPHGYLPLSNQYGNRSSMILFDKREQETRMVDRKDAWSDIYRFVLGTQVFVALGLGGKDPMVSLMIAAAEHQRRVGDTRPVGFWFCRRNSLNPDYANNLRQKRVVLVLRRADFAGYLS